MTAPRPLTQLQAAGPSARVIFRVVVIAVLVVLSLYLIFLLRRPLTWIFIAGFLAIALSGPVNFLARKMKRGLAIAIVYVALILFPILIGAILVPPVVEQLNNLIQNLPAYAGRPPGLRRRERAAARSSRRTTTSRRSCRSRPPRSPAGSATPRGSSPTSGSAS